MVAKLQTVNVRQFCQRKQVNAYNFCMEVSSLGCDWWKSIISLNNGITQKKQQASIYTMMTQFIDAYMHYQMQYVLTQKGLNSYY